ncbi:MAG: hypothetical protein U0974_11820 [Gemmatimonadales bacterium]|nr:hypothetical protein [Gemmatimonadales bacterium]MDZ4390403.1 hypothetical protein [Gemmatimonadales bacterium]
MPVPTIETVSFVPVSAFGFDDEVFADLADNAPFSWGDNNRTLVELGRIVDALDDKTPPWPDEVARLRAFANAHPGVYVDLEN